MQSQPRRLLVVRHAKAEQEGPSDVERALAAQGHRDAAAAGRWCAERGLVADHAWVSAARRTQETWEDLAAAADWNVEGSVDPGLYAAGVDTAVDLLRTTPADATTVVVVGHNPTMSTLAQLLDDGEGDPAAEEDMASGYPTSGLALFEYDGAWADLSLTSARLVAFHVARG